jgi:hypothetical protein
MQNVAILQIVGIVLIFGLTGIMSSDYTSFAQTENGTQTITAELDANDDISLGGSTYYYIDDVESNATGLEGIEETGDSLSSFLILYGDRISPNFSVKVPMADNPDRSSVEQIDVSLKIETIEEGEEGNSIYYGTPEFGKGIIGEYETKEGILEQTGGDNAIMTFILEK